MIKTPAAKVIWLPEAKIGDPLSIIAERKPNTTYIRVLYNHLNMPEQVNFLEPESHTWQTKALYTGK